MRIRTAVQPGGDKILAKGGGKQRTVKVDYNRSWDGNHGVAAGALIAAHGISADSLDNIEHIKHSDHYHDFIIPE